MLGLQLLLVFVIFYIAEQYFYRFKLVWWIFTIFVLSSMFKITNEIEEVLDNNTTSSVKKEITFTKAEVENIINYSARVTNYGDTLIDKQFLNQALLNLEQSKK